MPGVIRKRELSGKAAFSFTDLERQAGALLQQARREADRLLADARAQAAREAEQLRAQTRSAALADAQREALEQVRREAFDQAVAESTEHLALLASALAQSLDQFERTKSALLAAGERQIIELALAVAARVCKTQAAGDPQVAVANAAALLGMARHEHDLRLLVSQADHELLGQVLPDLISATGQRQHVMLSVDPGLQRGDCRLASASGTLDAQIGLQLDRVAAALCDKPDIGSCEPNVPASQAEATP